VGGTDLVSIDILVIVVTHRNLEAMLAEEKFREDLYFRIKVVTPSSGNSHDHDY